MVSDKTNKNKKNERGHIKLYESGCEGIITKVFYFDLWCFELSIHQRILTNYGLQK